MFTLLPNTVKSFLLKFKICISSCFRGWWKYAFVVCGSRQGDKNSQLFYKIQLKISVKPSLPSLFFSLAALKVFFLYLVFRNLTKCVQGWFSDIYSVSGSQSLLHLWVPVFQQIKKSLAIVSSKNFLLSHSVSSPSRTLDDTLLNCLTLLYRLRMFCPVFFSVSLSFTTKIIMMVWSLT